MYLIRIENRIFNLDRMVDAEFRPGGIGVSGEDLSARLKVRFSVSNEWDKEIEPYEVILFGDEAGDMWGSINAVMNSGGGIRR